MDKIQGIVYLVGAGPGDRNLITRKALDCLFTCDTVVYDYLAADRLLEETKPGCERIYVGKKAGAHSMKQEEINRILVEKAKEGKRVVRLKGGDPMVFGRGGEEALTLKQEGIPYEIVPGVTSVTAALSCAGIPVTHRGISSSFHVMTGHTMGSAGTLPEDFALFAGLKGTLVFLMGLNNLELIISGLLENGKSPGTPAAVIENGTLPSQRVVRGTLETIMVRTIKEGIHSPAIIVVGEVAALHLEPEGEKVLKGIRCGLVGTESFVRRLSGELEERGADTRYLLPMVLVPVKNDGMFTEMVGRLSAFHWLVFTSPNGVRLFFQKLLSGGGDLRAVGHLKFAVIGPGTADALKAYGFHADFMPSEYSSRGLGNELSLTLKREEKALVLRAARGSGELAEIFSERGISFEDIILYDIGDSNPEPAEEGIRNESCDYVIFGSGSGAEAYAGRLGKAGAEGFRTAKLACIGKRTEETLISHGLTPDIVAGEFSIRGLADAIERDVLKNAAKKRSD